MVGKRRPRFQTRTKPPSGVTSAQVRGVFNNENPQGRLNFGRSGGKGGGTFSSSPTDPFPRARQPQRPTNPHDPKSKDPFMRSGIGLGTNDTKIFTRAGMSMDLKKMRKMF